jgi:hypothetical protein
MKLNYISDSVKILIFAATVIITCMLVALGFQTAKAAKDISGNAILQMSELNNEIQDGDIKLYDQAEVYGSDVINFIKRYLGDFDESETAPLYVSVKTSLSDHTYTNSSNLNDIKNFANTMYIKPTALFQGEVKENENKMIIGVSFTQK